MMLHQWQIVLALAVGFAATIAFAINFYNRNG